MPTINKGGTVLLTGANGYIAMWIARKLLERGYSVRASVRSSTKGARLLEYFKAYGGKLEISIVTDLEKDGAFNEAVRGVDAVVHTASPIHWDNLNPQEVITPAVHGTIAMLNSVQSYGTNVKRVVVTSSIAALAQNSDPCGAVYTEKCWNNEAIQKVKDQGDKIDPDDLYSASKTLAEKAAWKFYEANKGRLTWDMTVLNVPWVFGPPIHDRSKPSGSMKLWWNALVAPLSDSLDGRSFIAHNTAWGDVRDIAEAHMVTLEKEYAGGERMIVTAGDFAWSEWVSVINNMDQSLLPKGRSIPPFPKVDKITSKSYNGAKANRLLGIRWMSKEECVRDIMQVALAEGW